MANNPKKVKDPTEVALSAIQEALNISDASVTDANRGSTRSETDSPSPSATPAFNESSFDTRPGNERPMFDSKDEPRATRRAANDDRETIGQLLQAIQKGRPARNVFTLATLFAGLWILGAAASAATAWAATAAIHRLSSSQSVAGILMQAVAVGVLLKPLLSNPKLAELLNCQ